MQQSKVTGGTSSDDVEEADRRNGEPGALHDRSVPTEVAPASDPHHGHLERHPHGDEMPSDVEVQAERQEEGMEAEEEHE